jgi:hypothetical protein
VVWTDADMTYPNERIPELVDEMDGWDQVVGARTSEQGHGQGGARARQVGHPHDRQLPDRDEDPRPELGLRAFRADVARQYLHLLPAGFSCVTTITMAFLANGYSVKYVPIEYRERAGTSKFHWWRDTKRYLIQVIRLVLSYNPLKIFLPLGAALGLVGLMKLGYDLVDKDLRIATNTLIILFASFQVLAIGLLADLVVRLAKRGDEVDPAAL